MSGPAGAARAWLERNAASVLLGAALLVAGALLLDYGDGLTFFQDTWDFLLNRRGFGADVFLAPHNEHIVLIPVGLEQLLLRIFGMDSARPEQVLLTVVLLATATVVFAYVRRRVGPWPALIAAVLLLFLGPAWQDLLWAFQISLVGSLLFGIAMLLALERGEGRGDAAACLLLAVSIGFSSLGLAFAVAAGVDVLLRRRERGLRRAWVVLVPLALYGAWYAGWGHDAEGHLSLHNVLVSPRYVVEGLAGSLGSLLALSTILDETVGRSTWGFVALGLLAALAAYGRIRGRRFSPRLWPVLAAAATFWFLAAFNFIPGREAYSSRYLYVGGVFFVLVGADLLDGVRFGRRVLVPAAVAAVAIAVVNLVPLREGRDFFREQTVLTRSDLAALEIARRTVDPSFSLSPEVADNSYLVEVQAAKYFATTDEYGSPAYTPAELARAAEPGRRQADIVLANALPVTVETLPAGSGPRRHCVSIPAGDRQLALRPGTTAVELSSGDPGTIGLRRFARGEDPLEGSLEPGTTALIRIPADRAARPWRLHLVAAQRAVACRE